LIFFIFIPCKDNLSDKKRTQKNILIIANIFCTLSYK